MTPHSKIKTAHDEEFLTEVIVGRESPFVGSTLQEALEAVEFEANLTQLIREGRYLQDPPLSMNIESGDTLTIRLNEDALQTLRAVDGMEFVPEVTPPGGLDSLGQEQRLVEIVITAGSDLVGETVESARFQDQYQTGVLAIRRGGETAYERLTDYRLRPGDLLLIDSDPGAVDRLADDPNVLVAGELALQEFRVSKLPIAVATILSVVGLAALGLLPIMVAALGGVIAMIVAGIIRPAEAYEAVQWDVIFLLAGVIPLGKALSATGGADLLGSLVASTSTVLPTIAVLGVFYLLTALMTNLISNQASVVLLLPVAVETAAQLNANAFAFVLAVTFAASTAFMTPIGYQTNLFVYGPGGYEFRDYARIGGPLQVLLAVVTTLGIALFWGL